MDYKNYNSSITIAYKNGWIHCASFGSIEVVRVKVDKFAYPIQVKSVLAAKRKISEHSKYYGGKK